MKKNYDFKKGAVIKGKVRSKSQVDQALKEQQKILTSIRLDKDVLEAAKECAAREGIGYLTWLNRKLRESVLNETSLEDRIKKLEKAVFKKKAV